MAVFFLVCDALLVISAVICRLSRVLLLLLLLLFVVFLILSIVVPVVLFLVLLLMGSKGRGRRCVSTYGVCTLLVDDEFWYNLVDDVDLVD